MKILCSIVALGFLLMLPAGYAQVTTPLHITTGNVILDEFGQPLQGTASAPGDLVQVLRADSGVIMPPLADGRPDPSNPAVEGGQVGIGRFMPRSQTNPGKFAVLIGGTSRPADASKLFVRVFNAPTLAEASFYEDSEVITVKGNEILHVSIARTSKALDPADDDGDGLNNSWEKSYDSNPANPDTDGDGMTDGEEARAGTGLRDPDSKLAMKGIAKEATQNRRVTWESVPGKRYQVQYTETGLDQNPEFVDIGGVVDADPVLDETSIEVTNTGSVGFYRVVLVEE